MTEVCEKEAIAVVSGKPWTKVPKDLFIPPEALKVVLESFEGPLALLLYLIKKDNIDILNIPIISVANQYLSYIELMETLEIDVAADYLVMAATLAELKSRELVPKPAIVAALEDEDEPDPKQQLILKLQLYQACKEAADVLDCLPQQGRDYCMLEPITRNVELILPDIEVNAQDLQVSLRNLLGRAKLITKHVINKDNIDIKQINAILLEKLDKTENTVEFLDIAVKTHGVLGLVLSFLAILQFAAKDLIAIVQTEIDACLYIQKK